MNILKKTFSILSEEEINNIVNLNNKLKINFNEEQKNLIYDFYKKFFTKEKENFLPTKDDINKIFSKIDCLFLRIILTPISFPLLNRDFIIDLKDFIINNKIDYIYDIGCGNGFLSFALSKYLTNQKIYSIDKYKEKYTNKKLRFVDVINENAISFLENDNNNKRLFLLSWASYKTDFAYNVLKKLKKDDILIYIGELMGGCNADDDFFNLLEKNFKISYKLNKNFTTYEDYINEQVLIITQKR